MSQATLNSTHEHDCNECMYLGSYAGKSKVNIVMYDLYYCPRDTTFIARFGTDGDYISSMAEHAGAYEAGHPIAQAVTLLEYAAQQKRREIMRQLKEQSAHDIMFNH